jgi:hypothetical protein
VLNIDTRDGVLVATADGAIWLTEVEVDGGGELDRIVAIGARLT